MNLTEAKLNFASWPEGSIASPLDLYNFQLIKFCFTQPQYSDMAHWLGAN
jgi:hypothetical protein